jgi:hypothetical protein
LVFCFQPHWSMNEHASGPNDSDVRRNFPLLLHHVQSCTNTNTPTRSCAAVYCCSCFVFSNSTICLLQSVTSLISSPPLSPSRARNVRRLGKTLSGSGIFVRTSRSAEVFHASATTPAMTVIITAVFALQLCGCAYQPPEGDHTCLGYLVFLLCQRR